jgi:pyrimidine-nucleoside phosphorylase
LLDAAIFSDYQEAYKALNNTLAKGLAIFKLKDFIVAQGGDYSVIDDYTKLLYGAKVYELKANRNGYISHIQSDLIGHAACYLGAGRFTKEDKLHYGVGFDFIAKIGTQVKKGDLICKIYHQDKNLNEVISLLGQAIQIQDTFVKSELILGSINSK